MIKAAVFDMDGTILNTIGDLTDSLNYALVETGHKGGHSEETVKLCFGWAMRLDMIKAIAMAKDFQQNIWNWRGTRFRWKTFPPLKKK